MKTKQQIKMLIDGINVNNNTEVYDDIHYLLMKLKAATNSMQRRVRSYDKN